MVTTRKQIGNDNITFSSFSHSDIVCRFSSLALCPDVHCPFQILQEAVSDYGTLLWAQSETAGEKGLPVLTDEDVNFLRLKTERGVNDVRSLNQMDQNASS